MFRRDLGEAMGEGLVKILETGDVEELVIRNLGDREVFIQAGDIVKGGKQDRVLTVSMIVPRIPATSLSAPFAWKREGGLGAGGTRWPHSRRPRHACPRRPPGSRWPSACSARSCRRPATLHRSLNGGRARRAQAFRGRCGSPFARCR